MGERRSEVLVTGANKGLGFATAKALGSRGYHVWVGARSVESGEAAVSALRTDHDVDADLVPIDVTDPASIGAAADTIAAHTGLLDVLVNNAGISPEDDGRGGWTPPSRITATMLRTIFDTNYFGVVETIQQMLPLLLKGSSPRIVNVSSALGTFVMNGADGPTADVLALGYKTSKAALNMATVLFARELAEQGVRVNAANPKLTATHLIGDPAELEKLPGFHTADSGAEAIIALATTDDPTTGAFVGPEGPIGW